MITIDDFRAYIGDTRAEAGQLERDLSVGIALVDRATAGAVGIPDAVMDQCYLIAASEVHARQDAPQGVSQFAAMDGAPIRISRDPLTPVYPIIAPYVGWFA
ncbi:hypothetical protein [Curtobacterium flaccumfaciens]|uniref:hypothetical protein n=1 Tax=Curtobacterium flaccumfaciens TaxID=2035 RepID=UPI00112D11B3|nr:hypothetical protein [Curtobacterium flaccumfaciens]TPG09393.1 hypothetical protein EAH85_03785 [Curtobacterium flaccumfaciens]